MWYTAGKPSRGNGQSLMGTFTTKVGYGRGDLCPQLWDNFRSKLSVPVLSLLICKMGLAHKEQPCQERNTSGWKGLLALARTRG